MSFASFQSRRHKLTTSGLDRKSQRHSTREKALKSASVQTKNAESLSTKKKKENRSAERRLCFNVFSIRSRLYWLIAFKIESLARPVYCETFSSTAESHESSFLRVCRSGREKLLAHKFLSALVLTLVRLVECEQSERQAIEKRQLLKFDVDKNRNQSIWRWGKNETAQKSSDCKRFESRISFCRNVSASASREQKEEKQFGTRASKRKTRSAMAPNKSTKNGSTSNHHHNNNNNNSSGSSSTSTKKKQPQKQIKTKKPKTRDSDCCSINFIKYVLIIIDIIFFVSNLNVLSCAHLSFWSIDTRGKFIDALISFVSGVRQTPELDISTSREVNY